MDDKKTSYMKIQLLEYKNQTHDRVYVLLSLYILIKIKCNSSKNAPLILK